MLIAGATLLTLEPRLALVLFLLLLLAAAAPILVGWMAILPAEREPFARPDELPRKKPRDAFAIFLLVNISLSVLLRIPALDGAPLSSHIARFLPADWAENALMAVTIWFGFVPGLAAAYCAVRANPIRLPLLIGGMLALVLWLAGPLLLAAIAASR